MSTLSKLKVGIVPSSFFLLLIIIGFAISPSFALGAGNRNLLLIGIMAFSPILILTSKKFYLPDISLILFMISIVILPLANQPDSMRWSTVMYSIMFGLTFLAYKQLLYEDSFSIENYRKLLRYLIYAYFIVLLIQQFCVLTGLPIFNLSNYNPSEPWKLNSLAAEPSHSARILAFLMYCYIVVQELVLKRKYNFKEEFKDDKWIWFAFLWTMMTMGSATAFLFITIVLLKFIRFKNLLPLIIIFILGIFFTFLIDNTGFERIFKVFMATLTLDPHTIVQADDSAAQRILPMILVAQMLDLTTLNGWFGQGIDSASPILGSIIGSMIPGVSENFQGGGLFLLAYEYGFIPFLMFLIFNFSNSFRKGDYISIIFWFMLVFMYGVNSQIVWLCITLLFTNKYFQRLQSNVEKI